MTHQECLLWLAARKIDCPCAPPGRGCAACGEYMQGTKHAPNCKHGCKGTGKVLRFPTLRQSREYHQDCIPFGFCNLDAICKVEVGNCQGRGWLPADNLEAELDIASKLLPGFILWPYAEDGKWIAQYRGTMLYSEGNEKPNEAVVDLIYKAVKAEEARATEVEAKSEL